MRWARGAWGRGRLWLCGWQRRSQSRVNWIGQWCRAVRGEVAGTGVGHAVSTGVGPYVSGGDGKAHLAKGGLVAAPGRGRVAWSQRQDTEWCTLYATPCEPLLHPTLPRVRGARSCSSDTAQIVRYCSHPLTFGFPAFTATPRLDEPNNAVTSPLPPPSNPPPQADYNMPMFNAKEKLRKGLIKESDIPYMQVRVRVRARVRVRVRVRG